jgi:ABC-type multidrug transport system fused ATPase/permease subunit
VIESGTHEQLLALQGVYHKLVKIQTELTRLEV